MTWAQCPVCYRFHSDVGPCPVSDSAQTDIFASPTPVEKMRPPQAHVGDPVTSFEAMHKAAGRAGTWRRRVLDFYALAAPGGATQEETHFALREERTAYSTIRSSVGDLKKAGWLRDSGERRPQRNGAPAVVWVMTDVGRDQLARERREAS